jgi:hypothetical protein
LFKWGFFFFFSEQESRKKSFIFLDTDDAMGNAMYAEPICCSIIPLMIWHWIILFPHRVSPTLRRHYHIYSDSKWWIFMHCRLWKRETVGFLFLLNQLCYSGSSLYSSLQSHFWRIYYFEKLPPQRTKSPTLNTLGGDLQINRLKFFSWLLETQFWNILIDQG